jgi:hypothetical protein
MAEIKQVFSMSSLPGIRRDGTTLDGNYYNDGQWVRFQRGRPKKMGGYRRITDQLSGPIRALRVWSRGTTNAVFSFSPYGIEQVLIDHEGLGASIIDRTPEGWIRNNNVIWSVDTQYDDAVGSSGAVVLAHASSSLANIDDPTASKPYLGIVTNSAAFTQITDAPPVSGGVFSVAPYTVVYGSDGFVAWSDANLPQNWYTGSYNFGDSGADRVTGAKIVKGLPLRSGFGPAALLWSLDSVIRMDYIGGAAIFRFTHLTTQSSILSQNSVIEYDGVYFWMGIDRFLLSDGGQVRELPNQMNINWVFDNLNYEHRQKVWAMKIPRYGEIAWFFPFGDATECTHCVIFNVREQTWYDNRNARSAGFYSQVFKYPLMAASSENKKEQVLNISSISGTIAVGDEVRSNTARGFVTYVHGTTIRVHILSDMPFDSGALTDVTSGASAVIDYTRFLYNIYTHEYGTDAIEGDVISAIESYFETSDFGLPTGGTQPNQPAGINRWTRLVRVEPDFIQEGEMALYVVGKEFANSPDVVSQAYNFTSETERIDMREQRREIRLRFVSNTIGGHYEAGRILLHIEPGDVRS